MKTKAELQELLRELALSDEQANSLLQRHEEAVKNGVPFVLVDTRHLPKDKAFDKYLAANSTSSFGAAFSAVRRAAYTDKSAVTCELYANAKSQQ